jgi:hypothetical protein
MEKLKQAVYCWKVDSDEACKEKTPGEYKSMRPRVSTWFKGRPLLALHRTME